MNRPQRAARKPELEHELLRDPRLGFEPAGGGTVRCLQHGVPWPFDCWHYHDEYELQIINRTTGQAFVGNHIGRFEPGYVALVGSRLPHTWISDDVPAEGIADRSMVIHFREEPLRKGSALFPEIDAVLPMLDRARAASSSSASEKWRASASSACRRTRAWRGWRSSSACCTSSRAGRTGA